MFVMNDLPHRQTWVKVNAHVDEDMAELIEALSTFPLLQTVESCQGSGAQSPWVCYLYGDYWADPWRSVTAFTLGRLAPHLAASVGDDARVSVEYCGSGIAQGHLTIRPGAVKRTAEAIRRLPNPVLLNPGHSSGYFCDRSDTLP